VGGHERANVSPRPAPDDGGPAPRRRLERAAVNSYRRLRECSVESTDAFRCWADTLPHEDEHAWGRYQQAAEREAAASLRYLELVRALDNLSNDSSRSIDTGSVSLGAVRAIEQR